MKLENYFMLGDGYAYVEKRKDSSCVLRFAGVNFSGDIPITHQLIAELKEGVKGVDSNLFPVNVSLRRGWFKVSLVLKGRGGELDKVKATFKVVGPFYLSMSWVDLEFDKSVLAKMANVLPSYCE